ncbi:sigma-70 family RNA polymerase sigma factor [Variovorax paradoxus]|uniref:Sigma-70 family RNA polymerase sigma factor n=1 Tax=Variovorax paradoxus TaxID=34073 RepID=A0A5Q0LVP7_VARPD|nr:RNA polymerase sigma factor [Variovorax paradoxus]QFZ81391.1 sigma-70 family RNA polymerase sigma factor [Variovorax paradoxus]
MSEEVRLVLLDFLSQRYGELKRRLTRLLGSDDLAGDALQDTWLRLRRLEDQGPVQHPRAFLLRMAVNIAVNNLRSQSRIVPRSEVDALLDVADTAPGPAEIAEARSEMAALYKVIARMPKRRRDILVLVRWQGLPQKDVAERLGVSLHTVEHELKRAHDFCTAQMGRQMDPKK